MAKMVIFENREVEEKLTLDDQGTLAKRYADLMLVAIDTAPPGGFTPKTNVEATELFERISAVKDDSEIKITTTDFNKIKKSAENMRLPKRSQTMAEFQMYLDELKPQEVK